MLSTLKPSPADPILTLAAEFRADPRADKLDLGVGVYNDRDGRTPILATVKAAERQLLEAQETKTYLGLLGDAAFSAALAELALGADAPWDRISAIQTPGGSGALTMLMRLAKTAEPGATLWIPRPSWPNHAAMAAATGLDVREYTYFDKAAQAADFAAMRADLAAAGPRDLVLLHGCCHNPTGADLTEANWAQLGEMAAAQGFVPLIDLAYLGFGAGLAEDAAPLRALAARAPEVLIAISCSKNFGLYRDRVGAAVVLSQAAADREAALANLMTLMRVSISMPPDHGAAAVRLILAEPKLRAGWEAELADMRDRMRALRVALAAALRRGANDDRFDFLANQRGMFSLLPASPDQIAALRADHGVYVVGDGRMNVAGLREDRIAETAAAFLAVGL